MVESSRYKYGKVICDLDVIILALEKKNAYYERIFEEEQVRRCHDTERYFDMNRKLQLALENETKANSYTNQWDYRNASSDSKMW